MTSESENYEKGFLLDLYRGMLRIRLFEDEVYALYSQAQSGGIAHFSTGQEATAVGVCAALKRDDYVTSTHRGHGHCLAKGADMKPMFAELLGRAAGYCRGKGGSMHIADPETGNLGANAIVGGSAPIAAGAAFSAKLRRTGQVCVCFVGEGAMNQGVLLESLNLAAIWQLPVIYACENNHYNEFTPMATVTAGKLRRRGAVFGIPSADVDGMDVLAVYAATRTAVQHARNGDGPGLLVFDTYRYKGHAMSDPNRPYRSREEERHWQETRDPLAGFARRLMDMEGVMPSELDQIDAEVQEEIEAAVTFAQEAPRPEPDEVRMHVYAE